MRETRHPEFASAPIAPDAFAAEYSKVRNRLPEQVRKPLDVSRDEVLEICKAHGVDHPTKLGREGTQPTLQTLEHVAQLLEDITYIFEHKEIPLGHKDWEVEIPEGHCVKSVVENNGKAFFSTTNHPYSVCCVFDSSGQFVYRHRGSMPLCSLIMTGQDIAYVIQQLNTSFVCRNGEIVGMFQGRPHEILLSNMGGKLVYVAQDGLKEKIFIDREVYGNPDGYEKVSRILSIGNQLVFAVQKEKGGHFYVYKGEQIMGDAQGYKRIDNMTEVNGKPVFTASNDRGDWSLYDDGILKGFCVKGHVICCIQSMDDRLSWVEIEEGGSTLFVEGESPRFYPVSIVRVVDMGVDEPVFVAQEKENDPWKLMQGDTVIGKETGYELTDIGRTTNVGGDIVFAARENENDPYKVESSSGLCFGSYEEIYVIKAIEDTHFIVIAKKDGKVVQRTFDIEHPPYQGEVNT